MHKVDEKGARGQRGMLKIARRIDWKKVVEVSNYHACW